MKVCVSIGVVAVVLLLVLSACTSSGEPNLLDELARVAYVERGQPTLVFVYTDG